VDLFTCGDEVNPWDGFKYLKCKLNAEYIETKEISRGNVDKIKKYSREDLGEVKFKPDAK